MGVRTAAEIATFSADTWALATASENLTYWGPRLQTFPRPEGNGFPGFTILALGLAGVSPGDFTRSGTCAAGGSVAGMKLRVPPAPEGVAWASPAPPRPAGGEAGPEGRAGRGVPPCP